MRTLLLRPELTAIGGTCAVFLYFALTAGGDGFLSSTGTRNYLEVAAEVGIIATAFTLLMIAGEFDLSVGATMGAAGVIVSYPIVYSGWPLSLALLLGFGAAVLIGTINWALVVKLGFPSFIVTLAGLFALRGATIAVTRSLTDTTQVSGIREAAEGDPLMPLFAGTVGGVSVSVLWWLGLVVLAAWLLDCTRHGNWIYATGGDQEAARRAGVPVDRVKWALFVGTAAAATLIAVLVMFQFDGAEVTRGEQKEFHAATATVIGGTQIFGGYGSPIGTGFGSLIYGMVNQGFFFTDIEDSWFQTFLGVMLLLAVTINTYTRSLALKRRKK